MFNAKNFIGLRRLSWSYLQPFRCNSLLKCAPQPKIEKKPLKSAIV